MLPREDFVFTIGYNGPIAVIDKQAKKKYGKLSTQELVEKGLFRAAYSSALYSGDAQECKFVAEAYKQLGGDPSVDGEISEAYLSAMGRLFGVFMVDVKRTMIL